MRAFGSDVLLRESWAFRARNVAAAMVFMTVSSGCTAPISATSDSVEFVCTVDGAKLLLPGSTDASICATFKQHVDEALPQASKAVQSASGADWIKVDIRFSKPASASAVVTRKNGAGERVHPEITVDVMDKPLGENEVKRLAEEVAKLVSAKGS